MKNMVVDMSTFTHGITVIINDGEDVKFKKIIPSKKTLEDIVGCAIENQVSKVLLHGSDAMVSKFKLDMQELTKIPVEYVKAGKK